VHRSGELLAPKWPDVPGLSGPSAKPCAAFLNLARAGVAYIPFHSTRHSAASLLLGSGLHPNIVSEMLGRSTVAITPQTSNSHVTPVRHREAGV
jgi:integrase